MIKISLLGDIMCEPLLLRAAKTGKTYDFSGVFENVKELLSESDFVVGNLETPLAGRKAGYVHELFSFNAPDEFAKAVKAAGVDFVSTANNHCMDRGMDGLIRTVHALDKIGLAHGGTNIGSKGVNTSFITTVRDTRIAIIPFTYGTNYGTHHQALPDQGMVNLLHSDTDPIYVTAKKGRFSSLKSILFKPLKAEQIAIIKKTLGMEYNKARKDDYLNIETAKPYFDKLEEKIRVAHEQADLVVFYPHVGGQFNMEPGKFTEHTIKKALEYGADAIIASHPHVVQKAEVLNGVPIYYSLGNFSMSPNSVYLLHENLPEYGIAAHLYIEDIKIVKTTFSILEIVEEKGKMLTVFPVDRIEDPNEEEIRQVYRAVTGKELTGDIICHEYEIE